MKRFETIIAKDQLYDWAKKQVPGLLDDRKVTEALFLLVHPGQQYIKVLSSGISNRLWCENLGSSKQIGLNPREGGLSDYYRLDVYDQFGHAEDAQAIINSAGLGGGVERFEKAKVEASVQAKQQAELREKKQSKVVLIVALLLIALLSLAVF